MKVTLNWLKEFLDFKGDSCDPEEIANLLTMSGTEVKRIEDVQSKYRHMVVGKILDYMQHPDADKLSVCKVDTGGPVLNIVCGAKNFKNNDRVVVALEGAVTAQGLKIKKSKLRGVLSEGMMCSEAELGLTSESGGIMILGDDFITGRSFASCAGLDDFIFELEITPNRPDCMSIMGIAREISALKKIEFLPFNYRYDNEINIDDNLIIDILNYSLCSRYSAKVFTDIPVCESPSWLKNRLIMCDYRPVDPVVDLTNYVMHEIGQPLHAFDKDLLYSDRIIIRTADTGESIRGIDESMRVLDESMLVIADEKKPVAIAGVMGGKETEINERTKNVLLESANFHGPSILRTSGALGLRTEASNRFEKKLDPEITLTAIKRFEELLSGITKKNFKKGIYDNYNKSDRIRKISIKTQTVEKVLGKPIDIKEISDIFYGLGIENRIPDNDTNRIDVTVPSSRYEDLEREIDLIEEIVRIHGFEKFESVPPVTTTLKGGSSFQQNIIRNIKRILNGCGLSEVINYSFLSEEWFKKFKLDMETDFKNPVKIVNPINEDFCYLRTTPLPLIVKNLILNINRGVKDINIFEITRIQKYLNPDDADNSNMQHEKSSFLPVETSVLGILLSGRTALKSWNRQEKYCDYYDLKGILEFLLKSLNINNGFLKINNADFVFYHPVINGRITVGNNEIGMIGKLHSLLLDSLDITQDVYYMEIYIENLIKCIEPVKTFEPIAQFPTIEADIAIVVDEEIKHIDIEAEIKNTEKRLLKNVRLFDIYRGNQIDQSRKSMAYKLTFQDKTRTLKDVEVEIIIKRIIENLEKKFKARLRE